MGDRDPVGEAGCEEAGMRHRPPECYDVFALARRDSPATLERLLEALSPLLDRVLDEPSQESAVALRSELARWVISIHYRQVEGTDEPARPVDVGDAMTLDDLLAHIGASEGNEA